MIIYRMLLNERLSPSQRLITSGWAAVAIALFLSHQPSVTLKLSEGRNEKKSQNIRKANLPVHIYHTPTTLFMYSYPRKLVVKYLQHVKDCFFLKR